VVRLLPDAVLSWEDTVYAGRIYPHHRNDKWAKEVVCVLLFPVSVTLVNVSGYWEARRSALVPPISSPSRNQLE
jgi:hypothetical protein